MFIHWSTASSVIEVGTWVREKTEGPNSPSLLQGLSAAMDPFRPFPARTAVTGLARDQGAKVGLQWSE